VDKTAKFYIDVFGMKEIARIDSPGARGYYLSDGDINLAILNFKNDAVAGVERGKEFSGIHHIGFQVESLEEIALRLAAAGSARRDDVNDALGVGHGSQRHANVEVKYSGPDGVMLDVSETGWVGSSGFRPQ
ncbi:MAG TPA: VOC family protein, partial [Methylomirabilota bacterium]|nr:VOC family protein [Methylomirabilota bacterium]